MKSKADIARERIEAQVITIGGVKCATGPLGLAVLYPPSDKPTPEASDTITIPIPTGAKARYSILIQRNDKMLVRVHAETGEVEYGEGYTPDGAARTFWQSLADLCPHTVAVKALADIRKLIEEGCEWEGYTEACEYFDIEEIKVILDRADGTDSDGS